ncbi:MAG: hypothetical protein M3N50_06705 [Pseudomonadota bacterium]|nr:hypothetical protein [Pseudomonadota bacterium]
MSFDRVFLWISTAALLSGCHLFSKLTPDCHASQEYQRATQVAPLKVPAGLDSPNTEGALVIPAAAPAPPPAGPRDACMDVPPRYKAAPPNKAASELASPAAPAPTAPPPESPHSPPR